VIGSTISGNSAVDLPGFGNNGGGRGAGIPRLRPPDATSPCTTPFTRALKALAPAPAFEANLGLGTLFGLDLRQGDGRAALFGNSSLSRKYVRSVRGGVVGAWSFVQKSRARPSGPGPGTTGDVERV
jgi:hypothetical protein